MIVVIVAVLALLVVIRIALGKVLVKEVAIAIVVVFFCASIEQIILSVIWILIVKETSNRVVKVLVLKVKFTLLLVSI